jgi:hypothetical protein
VAATIKMDAGYKPANKVIATLRAIEKDPCVILSSAGAVCIPQCRLAAILAEGGNDFLRIERSRIVAECHFDLHRIRAARYDVFLTMDDLEDVSGNDLEVALRAMDRISRYEGRALSKRKQALRKSND